VPTKLEIMPLNTDAYLKKRGWEGKGSGLRQGGLSKPLIITQKKSLAGLGKDRDEAYPFWDQ
jgi:nucleolar protein TMA23